MSSSSSSPAGRPDAPRLLLLLPPLGSLGGTRPKAPPDEEEEEEEEEEAAGGGEPPEAPRPGVSSGWALAALAKSFQKAEAFLLRHCVAPGLFRRLPPPRGPPGGDEGADPLEEPEEEEEEEEDAWPAGLAHLARVEEGPFLAGLSRGLRVHEDPRTETFQGHVRAPEATAAASAPPPPPPPPFSFHGARAVVARRGATLHALLLHRRLLRLARHFARRLRALQLFNRVAGSLALRQARAEVTPGTPSSGLAFPPERVLALLAEERGRGAARRLYLLLLGLGHPAGASGPPPWEEPEESWLLRAEPSPSAATARRLSAELRALCQEEEGALLGLLRELVASTDSLWRGSLQRPKQEEKPPGCAGAPDGKCLPGWKSVRWLDASFAEVATGLSTQYCPLLWRVAASTLACQLELTSPLARSPKASGAVLGQRLIHALAEGCVPSESAKELRALGHHLLLQEVLCHWDQGFCHALGSSLTDKCMARPDSQGTGAAACSQTGQLLDGLYRPLSFALRCLDPLPGGSAGDQLLPASFRLKLLSLSVATSHASCYWVMSKAHQYLASWSLRPFLLVTQGDLQVLKSGTTKLWAQVGEAFPKEKGRMQQQHLLLSVLEQDLCRQIHAMTTRVHLFTDDVLSLFSLDCKRMSSEIFSQTMPLGKHWRLPLRTELPASPSEYASAAVQTVLGQVLQSIQLLPREAQGLALSQVTTAFVEAWMEHILAQKIKFSHHGALQLKQDFDLVKALLQSEDYGLSPEIRQRVLSLQAFQQMDNAIACLLQQPCKASLPSHTWGAFPHCCSYDGIQTLEGGPGSLNSLESLEGGPAQGGAAVAERPLGDLLSHLPGPGGCSPETYLSPTHQEWLALRLHGGRRWRVPTLPCMSRTPEP